MTRAAPTTDLDPRFSEEGATATDWAEALDQLASAGTYWLTTVRADGRPHVTPLIAVWADGALHFCTGLGEQKARNLDHDTRVVLTTGTNDLDAGLDVVVEGDAERVTDDATLQRLADAWVDKYSEKWRFHVRDGAFHHGPGSVGEDGEDFPAHVYAVRPVVAFGFRKGDYSQTRWTFTG